MENRHAAEPWFAVGSWVESQNDGAPDICTCDPASMGQAHFGQSLDVAFHNARRIVACVNACAGITTDELESIPSTGGMLGPREDVARIARERDEWKATAEAHKDNFDILAGSLRGKCAELLGALKNVTMELTQLHAHHYPACDGGCPSDIYIAQANSLIAKVGA